MNNETQETKPNNLNEPRADSEKIPDRVGDAGGNHEVRFSSIQSAKLQAPGTGLVSVTGRLRQSLAIAGNRWQAPAEAYRSGS